MNSVMPHLLLASICATLVFPAFASAVWRPQSTDPLASIETGQSHYTERRYKEAQAAFQDAVKSAPQSARAHYLLGMAMYQQDKNEDALGQFQRSIKLDRKMAGGHAGVGLVLLRKKNRRLDARVELRRAVKLDPDNAQFQYYLGLSYIGQNSLAKSRGYGAYKDGQRYFKRAIDLDPQHPDAYYQLARSYEFPSREYEKAIPLYFRQIVVNPDHPDALSLLGSCSLEAGLFDEGLTMVEQLSARFGEEGIPGLGKVRNKLSAAGLLQSDDFEKSFESFEAYLARLEPKERHLYQNLAFLDNDSQRLDLAVFSESDKEERWRIYWASRDPDPSTQVNERLVEHYRRVLYSRTHFSRGQHPWDRRGEIYIRYGEPDDRRRVFFADGSVPPFPSGNNRVDVVRSTNPYRLNVGTGGLSSGVGIAFKTESWVYVPYGLELLFVDQMGRETYEFPLPMNEFGNLASYGPRQSANRLVDRVPEDYRFDFGEGPIDLAIDVVTFKDTDSRTMLDIAFSVPNAQLGHAGDGHGMTSWLDGNVVVRDPNYRHVLKLGKVIGPIERPLSARSFDIASETYQTSRIAASVVPGSYHSALTVRDRATDRVGIYKLPVDAVNYTKDSLQLSDIRLASSIKPTAESSTFVRHGLQIVPHPARTFRRDRPVFFYYEIYNLMQGESGEAHYRTQLTIAANDKTKGFIGNILSTIGRAISRNDDTQSVVVVAEDEASGPDAYQYQSIELGDSPSGVYTLTLEITDLGGMATASKSIDFTVAPSED
ncbi:MAG: tetratricopeptide repeat protein [Candidatus Latescibacteria bacterium]|nr:tetratricopeptide repeat protein [Candidatus Latescibacterota bacterium]